MSRVIFIWLIALLCVTNAGTAKSWAQNTAQNPANNPLGHPVPDPEAVKRVDEVNHQALVFTKQARALLKAGNLREAEQACRKSIAIEEELYSSFDPIGNKLLGEIYLQGGQNEKALERFRLVYPHGPDDRLKLNIALAYCQMGDYAQALRFYSDTHHQEFELSDKMMDAGNLPGTETLPELHATILLARGILMGSNTYRDEAIASFQLADKLVPKVAAVHFFWAEALHHANRDAEAIPHYDLAAMRGNGAVMKLARLQLSDARSHVESMKVTKEQQAKAQTKTGM